MGKRKKVSLGRTLSRTCFGRGNGPVCKRHNRMNESLRRCPQCVDSVEECRQLSRYWLNDARHTAVHNS